MKNPIQPDVLALIKSNKFFEEYSRFMEGVEHIWLTTEIFSAEHNNVECMCIRIVKRTKWPVGDIKEHDLKPRK